MNAKTRCTVRLARTGSCLLLFALVPTLAVAATIDFSKLSITPAGTIALDGVTITASNGGQVTVVEGEGLGVAGVGKAGGIDRIMTWTDIQTFGNAEATQVDPSIAIAVNGTITSLTVLPYMYILEGGSPITWPVFEMSYYPIAAGAAPMTTYNIMRPFQARTFVWTDEQPSLLQSLGLGANQPPESRFGAYLRTYNVPATVQFGFSVLALEYTPASMLELESVATAAPEPSLVTLCALGMALLRQRRRR